MKIMHITDNMPYIHEKTGGAEAAAEAVFWGLREQRAADMTNQIIMLANEVNASHEEKEFEFFVSSNYQKMGFAGRLLNNVAPHFQMNVKRQISSILKKEFPNIVHLHKFSRMGLAPLQAAIDSNKKIVCSIYDYWGVGCPKGNYIDDNKTNCTEPYKGTCKRCKIAKLINKDVFYDRYSHVDRFITLTDHSNRMVKKFLPHAKVETIPLPMSVDLPTLVQKDIIVDRPPTTKAYKKRVLFAGWLSYHKGVGLYLDAIRYLKEKGEKDIDFIVAGLAKDPVYAGYVADACKELDIKQYGRLSRGELNDLISSSWVVCVPELWCNMNPIVVSEAMGLAKTVVATKIGGLPELIEDGSTGYLAELTPESLGEKILQALEKDTGLAAREAFTKRHDPKTQCDKLHKLYEEVLR